jgi:hypothetical protein
MMQRQRLRGVLAAVFPRAALAGSKVWRTLFDGRSLDGWMPIGEANWSLKDGCAEADNGKTGFLVSDETFGDVEIRAEFWVSDDANSGIFIRCTNPAKIATNTAYEVNIYDQRPDQTLPPGRSWGRQGLADAQGRRPLEPDGDHRQGDRFSVALNQTRSTMPQRRLRPTAASPCSTAWAWWFPQNQIRAI